MTTKPKISGNMLNMGGWPHRGNEEIFLVTQRDQIYNRRREYYSRPAD